MGLNAYVVRKEEKDVLNDDIFIERRYVDRKPLFSLWENEDIIMFFNDYGDNYLAKDYIGELYINEEQFDDFKEEIEISEYEEYSDKKKEVLSFIDSYLSMHFELTLTCF